jgi:hypothetical protein
VTSPQRFLAPDERQMQRFTLVRRGNLPLAVRGTSVLPEIAARAETKMLGGLIRAGQRGTRERTSYLSHSRGCNDVELPNAEHHVEGTIAGLRPGEVPMDCDVGMI